MVLTQGGEFHTHRGIIDLDAVIGLPEGSVVKSTNGDQFLVLRPLLVDYVMSMPRGAQVVYPKDAAQIVHEGDIFPGARVLEAGTGSGSLTLALCRATGPAGRVVSYDLRREFQTGAARNIESFFGKAPDWLELREGDVRDVGGSGETFDRAILDLPEPWGTLEPLSSVLPAGAIFCGYLPTTNQVQQLVLALERNAYEHLETFEVLHRSWHVTARSVRPDQRMVGHTGFITLARRV